MSFRKKERKKERRKCGVFLFVLLLVCTQSGGHAIVLDRNQLATWYPNYLTSPSLYLNSQQITSISSDTFTELSQFQGLYLDSNQFTSLDASIFNGLNQLEALLLNGKIS